MHFLYVSLCFVNVLNVCVDVFYFGIAIMLPLQIDVEFSNFQLVILRLSNTKKDREWNQGSGNRKLISQAGGQRSASGAGLSFIRGGRLSRIRHQRSLPNVCALGLVAPGLDCLGGRSVGV